MKSCFVYRLMNLATPVHVRTAYKECYEFENICIVWTNLGRLMGEKSFAGIEHIHDVMTFTLSASCYRPLSTGRRTSPPPSVPGRKNVNLWRYTDTPKTCLFWSNSNHATSKNCGSLVSSQIASINYIYALTTQHSLPAFMPPSWMENIATNQLAGMMIIGGFIKSDDRYYINPYICMGRAATLTGAYSKTQAYVLTIFAFCSFHRTSEPSNIDRH